MRKPKNITVIVHQEGGSLWAEVEEYPGCFASGRNEAELFEVLTEALSMYLSEPGQRASVQLQELSEPVARERVETRKAVVCV